MLLESFTLGPRTRRSALPPLPNGCLAKVLKGVFGLADAPRQWWLKLAKSLEKRGWVRSALDQGGLVLLLERHDRESCR